MLKIRSVISAVALVALVASCQQSFKKGEKGIEYKIISEGKGSNIKIGNFLRMHISQLISSGKKDSLLNDTRKNGMPIIESFDSTSIPPEYITILSQMKKGDSLIMRLLADSMFAENPGSMPPFIKKGDYFVTTVRLLDVYNTSAEMEKAKMQDFMDKQKKDSIDNIEIFKKQDAELTAYFKKNNITNLQKTASGVYVQILQPGTGAIIDTSVVVTTNYTGRTMDGTLFDSNTDPSKGHVEPFNVNLTDDVELGAGVIKGWTDGLKMLNKGAKAKFYIPSPLAYGKQKMGNDIKENSILIFDIEVVDVLNRAQAKAAVDAKRKIMKAKQERFYDSIKKAMPDTIQSVEKIK
jgi:FKBP-type peptidyl-prolyl cis-trans isomerase